MHVLYPCTAGGKQRRNRWQRDGGKKEKNGWNERQSEDVGSAKEILGEREGRMRPVTCGCHPHPIYLHFIISLISITSHISSPPFHLLIKVLQLLWAWGKQRDREGGGGCKDRPMIVRKNVIDLRRNNVLEAYIFIYPYMNLYPKVLLPSVNFQNVQKVSHTPSGGSYTWASKILAEGG